MKKLTLTGAVAIDGVVHKAGSTLTVDADVAKGLIYRGKAVASEGAAESAADAGRTPKAAKKAAE